MLDELLDLLEEELPGLMHQWSPCDNDSDYKCTFCHNRAKTNQGDITHADNCSGVALQSKLAAIRSAEKE